MGMDGIYRPIAFWGCTLRDAELNYTVTEKEALAVVKALKNYEDMLQGAKVTVITDHKPLLLLLQAAYKAPPARLRRWALAITDFDFDIKYEPGATHFLPDYLSRVHHDDAHKGEYEPEVGCELFFFSTREEELTMASIIHCAGSRGPSCSPNRGNGYFSNPSPQKARKGSKKGSSTQRGKPSQLEKATATGGQRETRDQTHKSLHQNTPRDESSPNTS